MSKIILKEHIKSVLLEYVKKDKFDVILSNLEKEPFDFDGVEDCIYNYLRVSSKFKSYKKDKSVGSALIDAYLKHHGDLTADLETVIKEFFVYLESNIDPTKGNIEWQNPWYSITFNDGTRSIRVNQDGDTESERRHNLYFSITYNDLDFEKKTLKASGIVNYFKDLKILVHDIFNEMVKINNKYNDCVFQFKIPFKSNTKAIVGGGNMGYRGNVLENFFAEADNLKVYLGNVSRDTGNIQDIRKEVVDAVGRACNKNNFTVTTRKRSQIGYDFRDAEKKEKYSFGEAVAFILAKQIESNDKLKDQIKSPNGQDKLDDYIQQTENFISNPKNSVKVIEMLKSKVKLGIR